MSTLYCHIFVLIVWQWGLLKTPASRCLCMKENHTNTHVSFVQFEQTFITFLLNPSNFKRPTCNLDSFSSHGALQEWSLLIALFNFCETINHIKRPLYLWHFTNRSSSLPGTRVFRILLLPCQTKAEETCRGQFDSKTCLTVLMWTKVFFFSFVLFGKLLCEQII